MADYDKVGLLAIRNGKVLLCRKRHTTSLLILPGGCKEPGESPLQCLLRELREELGGVTLEAPEFVGTYTDIAAGAPAKTVRVELYQGTLLGEPEPHAEIRELVWFGEADDAGQLAPSLVNTIFPDLLARGLLAWPAPGRFGKS